MAEPFVRVRIDYKHFPYSVLNKLYCNYAPAVTYAMDTLADAYKERVQLAMVQRKVPGPPLSPFTIAKRRAGKAAGKWPSIPTYYGTRPFMRSGTLMQSIKRKKIGSRTWQVGPAEGIVMPFSGSSTLNNIMTTDRAMGLLEYGFTVSIPETDRMRRYLRRMYYKASKAGSSSRRHSSRSVATGRILTVRIPPRPVFHDVHKNMLSEYEDIAKNAFEKRFWKGIPRK